MHIVCTAGHVDHGKSALVEALTGSNPDQLAEEQIRGLSINLGFTWRPLQTPDSGSPTQFCFVDVPGHERFIGNMLVGASGAQLVLFVVAADEGWMPQSREHAAIVELLGLRRGVIALTKLDLVDDETADIAEELLREEVKDSILNGYSIVRTSARRGDGLAELHERLVNEAKGVPAALDYAQPRLWVDRSFTKQGAGTVVAGVLEGGSLALGDEVSVVPGTGSGRIRAMEQLGQSVLRAGPGSRVALNVPGVDRSNAGRGRAVVATGQGPSPVRSLEGWIRVLPGKEVKPRGAWQVHIGSGRWPTKVIPVRGGVIQDEGFIRMELNTSAPLIVGDKFILREAGSRLVVGGGVVVSVLEARRPRGTLERDARTDLLRSQLRALASGGRESALARFVCSQGAIDRADAASAFGFSLDSADAVIRACDDTDVAGPYFVSRSASLSWKERATDALSRFHDTFPLEAHAPRDIASQAMIAGGCPPPLSASLIRSLELAGVAINEGGRLRLAGHSVSLSSVEEDIAQRLIACLAEHRLRPPRLSAAAQEVGASDALVRAMYNTDRLIFIDEDRAVVPEALEDATNILRQLVEREGPVSVSRAKEAFGSTRAIALPLLYELDRRHITLRFDDLRTVNLAKSDDE